LNSGNRGFPLPGTYEENALHNRLRCIITPFRCLRPSRITVCIFSLINRYGSNNLAKYIVKHISTGWPTRRGKACAILGHRTAHWRSKSFPGIGGCPGSQPAPPPSYNYLPSGPIQENQLLQDLTVPHLSVLLAYSI
jgi:hypothetical protein